MLTTLNNAPHELLGSAFPDYFKSYTNEALAVPLSLSEETNVRAKAAKTVDWIIALGGAPKGAGKEAARYITFSMLRSILDATKIPEEIKRLADPRLVAGCVELMAPMESLFGYECGYVCFRILNFAINACLLKLAGRLDDTIRRMGLASDSLLLFWGDSATEVYLDLQRTETIALRLCAAFTPDVLDQLVELLHANQKQYFIVLRVLQSVGLSGLMLILRAHIQDGGIETPGNMHGGALNESLMHSYSRLLWRYLLAVPVFIKHEAQAVYQIHLHVTYWARFRDSHYIDIEDSRNLLQALNERLLSSRMLHLTGAMILLRFVEPLVVPGCEDLIPTLVERSLRLMWSSILNDGPGTNTARTLVGGFLTSIRYILQEVEPKYLKQQKWIVELVECIIDEGLTDLVLRVLVAAPDFVPGQQGATERLYDAASEFYEELLYVVPKSYLALRLNNSGVLADWRKYANHFFGAGTALQASSSSSLRSTRKACGEVVIHMLLAVHNKKHMHEVYPIGGSCDNPRCPMPCDAPYICSECVDLVYCGIKCLTADWSSPWRGPHKRVCRQQAMANPKSRSSYHGNIGDSGRAGMDIVRRSQLPEENMVISYHCDDSEWMRL